MEGNFTSAGELYFEAYGVTIGVEVSDARAVEKIKLLLPFYSQSLDAPTNVEHKFKLIWNVAGTAEDALYQNEELIVQRVDTDRLLALLDTFFRMTIAENAPGHIFIHAGVVGIENKAIIFPAKSYSGKTTIVAELLKHGAEYFSDEYAVIDGEGFVNPYPKPLSMRKPGEIDQIDRSVESLGGRQAVKRLPIGRVIVTEFVPGAEWKPEILTPGQGVMELIPHSLAIKFNPKFTLRVLNFICNRAIITKSQRGDVSQFARLILNLTIR
jgi:hypothetical protein